MGDYHFYSDETSDIRRGEAESDIILARLNKSDNRPFPNRLTVLSAFHRYILKSSFSKRRTQKRERKRMKLFCIKTTFQRNEKYINKSNNNQEENNSKNKRGNNVS